MRTARRGLFIVSPRHPPGPRFPRSRPTRTARKPCSPPPPPWPPPPPRAPGGERAQPRRPPALDAERAVPRGGERGGDPGKQAADFACRRRRGQQDEIAPPVARIRLDPAHDVISAVRDLAAFCPADSE